MIADCLVRQVNLKGIRIEQKIMAPEIGEPLYFTIVMGFSAGKRYSNKKHKTTRKPLII